MFSSEYESKVAELFAKKHIPVELRAELSYIAYEKEHAYGYHEVYQMLEDMVYALEKPLKDYTQRIIQETLKNQE